MKENMKEKLIRKDPLKLMFEMALPAVIGMLVIGLYPLMDGIFAGQILGQEAMTACSISMPITFINNGIATLIGMGSASILSRAMGKEDKEKADKIMGNLIYWVLLFSVIIGIGGYFLAPHFIEMLGASGQIKDLGVRYVRIIFMGSIFVNFTQSSNMVMRGEGKMKKAMMIMALGALINIVLDPILMKSMGNRGIEGGAIATVTAQIIQAILSLYYFLKKSPIVKIGKIRPEKEIYKEMFGIGVSAMLMQVLFMVQQTLLYKQAFQYGGDSWGILMSAILRFYGFSFIPLWGMSQGLQPIVGTNFGAQKYERVKASMKIFILFGTFLSALFYIPAQIFTRNILDLFKVSPEIIGQGMGHFRTFYSVYILYAAMIMSITFFQAIGDGKKAGIIVMSRQLILFVPAMLFLPILFGPSAVWWAEPLVDFVVILYALYMLKKEISSFSMVFQTKEDRKKVKES